MYLQEIIRIVNYIRVIKIKICPKCKGFTYSDDADKCIECDTKLEQGKPNDIMGIDQRSYLE